MKVKPNDSFLRGYFPLANKSTYSMEFGDRSRPK